MRQVKDPVCGMMIDPDTAAGRTTYESRDVYFCSDECRRSFESDPASYYDQLGPYEPSHTTTKGMTAPKFGSAGSGGLEYEGSPEVRGRR
jgi:Cu+-exporting ATPase